MSNIQFGPNGDDEAITPCEKGPYAWVPANCLEVDGEWYFLIKWRDAPGKDGWIGTCSFKKKIRIWHGHDGEIHILNKQHELFQ